MKQSGLLTYTHYVALTADLVGSRRMADRARLQHVLLELVNDLNQRYASVLQSNAAITAGDELQLLLHQWPSVVDFITELSDAVFPQHFYFGIGLGTVVTALSKDVGSMDGSCFHQARDAVTQAKKTGTMAHFKGFGDGADAILSALYRLVGTRRRNWTDKQGLYSIAARHMKQKQVAEKFAVSPSVVSESLKSSYFDDLLDSEQATRLFLRDLQNRLHAAAG